MARRADDARCALQFARHVASDELLDHLAAQLGGQVTARNLLAVAENGQNLRIGVETRIQRGEPLITHQHQEIDLWQMPRRLAVEAARPVLDGIGAVKGDRLARLKTHACQRLGRKTLYRVAIKVVHRNHGKTIVRRSTRRQAAQPAPSATRSICSRPLPCK